MNSKIQFSKISLFSQNSVRKFQSLIILTSTPLIFTVPSLAEIPPTQQIAQAVSTGSIKRPNLATGSQGEAVVELQAALKLLGFYNGAVDGIYSDGTAMAVSKFKQAAGLKADNTVDAATWERLFPGEAVAISNNSANSPNSSLPTPFPTPTQTTTNQQNRSTQVVTKPVVSNQRKTPQPRETVKPVSNNRNPQKTNSTQTRQTTSTSSNRNPKTTFPQKPGIQYTLGGMPILRLGMRGSEVTQAQQHLKKLGYLATNPDGDFGVETESAVKAIQKRFGLEADGIVGGETWDLLTRRRK
jgi:peptidoglycan hydrolase-like protein with peptidoglycan-binding domain